MTRSLLVPIAGPDRMAGIVLRSLGTSERFVPVVVAAREAL